MPCAASKSVASIQPHERGQVPATVPSERTRLLPRAPSSSPALYNACEVAPHSAVLWDFFAQHTCGVLSLRPTHKDPFALRVFELSSCDELMAHCVLALGGVHLNWNGEAALQIQVSSTTHYDCVLSSLRNAVGGMREAGPDLYFEMALKILTVCHIEVGVM